MEVNAQDTLNWETEINVQPSIVSTTVIQTQETIPELEKTPDAVDTVNQKRATSPVTESAGLVPKDSVFTIEVRKTEHIVQAGETLYAIAHQYNLGIMDLVHWNGLNLQEGIKPGQVLRLSGEEEVTASTKPLEGPQEIVHEVRASDTLYSVARKYGVTIKELMDWNGKKDFNVTVGEKIKILRK